MLALKGNQGQCHEEIKSYLDDAVARHDESAPAKKNAGPLAHKETVGKRSQAIGNTALLAEHRLGLVCRKAEWEGLCSVGMVESVRQVGAATA